LSNQRPLNATLRTASHNTSVELKREDILERERATGVPSVQTSRCVATPPSRICFRFFLTPGGRALSKPYRQCGRKFWLSLVPHSCRPENCSPRCSEAIVERLQCSRLLL